MSIIPNKLSLEFNSENNINNSLFPGKTPSNEIFFDLVFDRIATEENLIEKTAEVISQNEIIATCYSNIETGPRALGHRSLICNAHNADLIKVLSTDIKKRNLFIDINDKNISNKHKNTKNYDKKKERNKKHYEINKDK